MKQRALNRPTRKLPTSPETNETVSQEKMQLGDVESLTEAWREKFRDEAGSE